MENIPTYQLDGALGLGLLDNFYDPNFKKLDLEFFKDFDNGNAPTNIF